MVLITNLHKIKHLIQGCIIGVHDNGNSVKLFLLNDKYILVDACKENDLSRNL